MMLEMSNWNEEKKLLSLFCRVDPTSIFGIKLSSLYVMGLLEIYIEIVDEDGIVRRIHSSPQFRNCPVQSPSTLGAQKFDPKTH